MLDPLVPSPFDAACGAAFVALVVVVATVVLAVAGNRGALRVLLGVRRRFRRATSERSPRRERP